MRFVERMITLYFRNKFHCQKIPPQTCTSETAFLRKQGRGYGKTTTLNMSFNSKILNTKYAVACNVSNKI